MSFNDGFSIKPIPFVQPLAGTASLLISTPDGTGWTAGGIVENAISASVYVIETIETEGNIDGNGAPEDKVRLKDNISLISVTASFKGNLNGTASNAVNAETASYVPTGSAIETFVGDVRAQLTGSQYVNYDNAGGIISLPFTGSIVGTTPLILGGTTAELIGLNNLNTTNLTASFITGDGKNITDITASNITNFTSDVRVQITGSQYVSYNNVNGTISLPFTGSTIGTTPLILGQNITSITGLTSISASNGAFNNLSASTFNLGTMTALTSTTGDLIVNNLIVNGVIENGTGNVQIVTSSAYQIIPNTSLVKISAPSGSVTLNATFPTIKTNGYNEGTRIFIVNVGTNTITFKDEGAVTGTKLKMANQTYNQPQWGCIQFVLVSGSLGKVWIEAGRGG